MTYTVDAKIFSRLPFRASKSACFVLANGDVAGLRAVFVALGRRWSELEPCSDLVVSCKFSYGKHGEAEMLKLFKRLGIDDVFTVVTVTTLGETYEGQAPTTIDIKGMVNSLTGIRNNILHQDESPTLTSESLRQQSAALKMFAVELVKLLQATADGVEQQLQAEGVAHAG